MAIYYTNSIYTVNSLPTIGTTTHYSSPAPPLSKRGDRIWIYGFGFFKVKPGSVLQTGSSVLEEAFTIYEDSDIKVEISGTTRWTVEILISRKRAKNRVDPICWRNSGVRLAGKRPFVMQIASRMTKSPFQEKRSKFFRDTPYHLFLGNLSASWEMEVYYEELELFSLPSRIQPSLETISLFQRSYPSAFEYKDVGGQQFVNHAALLSQTDFSPDYAT